MKRRITHDPRRKQDKLAELGISNADFERYLQMFCSNRLKVKYLKMTAKGWCQFKGRWWQGLILSHLLGSETVALYPAVSIDYLMFDIDNHNAASSSSVSSRCYSIIKLFDADPLLFTSSDSGGMRVCYFLDRAYYRDDVHEYAQRTLGDNGMLVRNGYIEIMAGKNADRLPLGSGSFLVDPITLEPIYDLTISGMIDKAWDIYNSERLSIAGAPTCQRRRSTVSYPENAEYLEEHGLPATICTNDALLALNRKYMGSLRLAADQATAKLKSWIRNHHNGNSSRANAGDWTSLDLQIDRIVQSFDPDRFNSGRIQTIRLEEDLTLGDVDQICFVIDDPKLQSAAFSLLEWVKNRGTLLDTRELAEDRHLPSTRDSIRNYYVVGFLQSWMCEIPYASFKIFDGFDKTHPTKTINQLDDIGLLKPWKWESKSRHKCRTYIVNFSFDYTTEKVAGFDQALLKSNSRNEVMAKYGRYRADRVFKDRKTA